jgi:hypothetical protein
VLFRVVSDFSGQQHFGLIFRVEAVSHLIPRLRNTVRPPRQNHSSAKKRHPLLVRADGLYLENTKECLTGVCRGRYFALAGRNSLRTILVAI